jgi:hypothetical protein
MTDRTPLNLNLATRPLRNRRLYMTAVRAVGGVLVVLAGLAAFVALKDGRALMRLRKDMAETRRAQSDAQREERRLAADIGREEKLSLPRVNLVNSIIQRKMFSWTGLLTELEKCLPGPSYLTALTPSFTPEGAVALQMRVISRNLEDLMAFTTALNAGGFKSIQVGAEQRSEDGRLISEITTTYERPL